MIEIDEDAKFFPQVFLIIITSILNERKDEKKRKKITSPYNKNKEKTLNIIFKNKFEIFSIIVTLQSKKERIQNCNRWYRNKRNRLFNYYIPKLIFPRLFHDLIEFLAQDVRIFESFQWRVVRFHIRYGRKEGFCARASFAAIRSFCRRRIREFIARLLGRGGRATISL